MSDSVQPHRWQPTRLPRPWDSPGKNTGVGCHFLLQCGKVRHESEVAQSCPTLSNSVGCSLPGSSVHGIFQARVLEWGATVFSVCKEYRCTNISESLLSTLLGIYPVFAGSYGNSMFNFLRNHHAIFHSGCLTLHSYHQCKRVLISPHLCQSLFPVF